MTAAILARVQFLLFCGVVCELGWLDAADRRRYERIEAYLIARAIRKGV